MTAKGKLTKRIFAAVLVVGLTIGTALAANTPTVKNLVANYMGIKLVVNGVQVTPKDGNGNVVDPFIVDGTTYLPVRAVGEALGLDVNWDGETKTVYIGEIPGQGINWMTKLPPYQVHRGTVYDGSDPKKSFSVAGNTQTLGVTFEFSGGAGETDGIAIWNTNSQYKTMTLTVGHMGNKDEFDATMEVYLDGVYSTEYELKYDAAPKTITIPLNYAPNVKLQFVRDRYINHTYYGIYDISFS